MVTSIDDFVHAGQEQSVFVCEQVYFLGMRFSGSEAREWYSKRLK